MWIASRIGPGDILEQGAEKTSETRPIFGLRVRI